MDHSPTPLGSQLTISFCLILSERGRPFELRAHCCRCHEIFMGPDIDDVTMEVWVHALQLHAVTTGDIVWQHHPDADVIALDRLNDAVRTVSAADLSAGER